MVQVTPISKQLQEAFDAYYPDGPTDLEYLRFYANLALRALFYADGQGVLNSEVLSKLLDQAYGAEQNLKKEAEETEDVD
jgi:hypothetical protein